MEGVRVIRTLVFIGLVAAVILVVPAPAWDTGAHNEFNKIAVESQEDAMNTALRTSSGLYNNAILDNSVQIPGHVMDLTGQDVPGNKNIENWFIYGAESADFPVAKVLNHFYDPETKSGMGIPAPQYAVSTDRGASAEKKNPYSWSWAKWYFQQAVASTENNNIYYGDTWRSVGESMHMVTDMFVPAHVRNDPHPKGDPDPLELVTNESEVRKYAGGNFITQQVNFLTMQQNGDIQSFMIDAAQYTHDNYYSKDTIPIFPASQVWSNNYTTKTIDGEKNVRMATRTIITKYRYVYWGEYKEEKFSLDNNILTDQKKLLIPNSIKAAKTVLQASLPKFRLTEESVKVVQPAQNPGGTCSVQVKAWLTHQTNGVWTTPLNVNNGAYYRINQGTWTALKPAAYTHPLDGQTLVTFTTTAQEGDLIQVIFNLGGYAIYQEQPPLRVSGCTQTITSRPTTLPTTALTTLTRTPTKVKTTVKPTPTKTSSPNCFWCGDQAHGGVLCSRDCQGTWDPNMKQYVICKVSTPPKCYCLCPA
jgi:hypothetical protein